MTELHRFSVALITSDGVHGKLGIDEIEEILNGAGSYAEKCETLVRRAEEAGSRDDLSAVIICTE